MLFYACLLSFLRYVSRLYMVRKNCFKHVQETRKSLDDDLDGKGLVLDHWVYHVIVSNLKNLFGERNSVVDRSLGRFSCVIVLALLAGFVDAEHNRGKKWLLKHDTNRDGVPYIFRRKCSFGCGVNWVRKIVDDEYIWAHSIRWNSSKTTDNLALI